MLPWGFVNFFLYMRFCETHIVRLGSANAITCIVVALAFFYIWPRKMKFRAVDPAERSQYEQGFEGTGA
jgi:hypothetical protein